MSNAIKWISRKAKELRRKHPGRKWSTYIKEASASYRSTGRASGGSNARKKHIVKPLRNIKRRVKRSKIRRAIVKRRISAVRPPGARIVKHRRSGGTNPIAWHVVKLHEMGFKKSGHNYVTIGGNRRIVWQTWDAREAKAYLKKHCLHDK